MKKFEITEQQIKQAYDAACEDWKQRIKEWFPEWNKKQSGWRKFDDYPKYLIYIDYENNKAYGFDTTGKWFEDVLDDNYSQYDPVDDEKEVEERLIEEAKRRGFKRGCSFVNLFNGKDFTAYLGRFELLSNRELVLDNNTIFNRSGKWAEIISTPEPDEYITVNNTKYKRCN